MFLPSTPKGREKVVPARDDGGETTGPTVLGTTHAVPGHGTQGREREGWGEVHECNMWVGVCNVCRWGVYMCVWMWVHVPIVHGYIPLKFSRFILMTKVVGTHNLPHTHNC